MTFEVKSPQHLKEIFPQIFSALSGSKKIALYGEMGAGKTTFVSTFCQFMQCQNAAASPTFSLVNEYRYALENGKIGLIRHLDLYRLKIIEEALDFGIEDFIYDENYLFVEWPQLIEPLMADEFLSLEILATGKQKRQIIVK